METRISTRLSPREGRKFGLTVGTAFLVLAGVALWRNRGPVAVGFTTVSVVLLVAGLLIPGRLGPIYRGWMAFAHLLSKFTTPVFMAITFYVVFLPTGALMRLLGRNPLERTLTNGSFWVARSEEKGAGIGSGLERQF